MIAQYEALNYGPAGGTYPISINTDAIVSYRKTYQNKPMVNIPAFTDHHHIKPGMNIIYYTLSKRYQEFIDFIQVSEGGLVEMQDSWRRCQELTSRIPSPDEVSADDLIVEMQGIQEEMTSAMKSYQWTGIPVFDTLKFEVYENHTYNFDTLNPVSRAVETLSLMFDDYQTMTLEDFQTRVSEYYINELQIRYSEIHEVKSNMSYFSELLDYLIQCCDSMYEDTRIETGTDLDEIRMKAQFNESAYQIFNDILQRTTEYFSIITSTEAISSDDVKHLIPAVGYNNDAFDIIRDLSFIELGSSIGLTLPGSDYNIYSSDYSIIFQEKDNMYHEAYERMYEYAYNGTDWLTFVQAMDPIKGSLHNITEQCNIYRSSLDDLTNTIDELKGLKDLSDTDLIERIIDIMNSLLLLEHHSESDIDSVVNQLDVTNIMLRYYYDNVSSGYGKELGTCGLVDDVISTWCASHDIHSLQLAVNHTIPQLINILNEIYENDNVSSLYVIRLTSGDTILSRSVITG